MYARLFPIRYAGGEVGSDASADPASSSSTAMVNNRHSRPSPSPPPAEQQGTSARDRLAALQEQCV